MLTFPSAPNHVRHMPQTTGLASASSESQPFSSEAETQLSRSDPGTQLSCSEAGTQQTDFSQISAHASGHDVIHIPRTYFLSGGFYFDISEWHKCSKRACTPALMLHQTNPCANQKVLSQTKPKSKIYKTKSLGHYITLCIPQSSSLCGTSLSDCLVSYPGHWLGCLTPLQGAVGVFYCPSQPGNLIKWKYDPNKITVNRNYVKFS